MDHRACPAPDPAAWPAAGGWPAAATAPGHGLQPFGGRCRDDGHRPVRPSGTVPGDPARARAAAGPPARAVPAGAAAAAGTDVPMALHRSGGRLTGSQGCLTAVTAQLRVATADLRSATA